MSAGEDHVSTAPLPPPPPHPAPVGSAASRWPRLGTLGAVALAGGACLYVALVDPNTSAAYPTCPLKALTGVDCAGCGGLRATHALLTGDPVRAADHNLLLVLALPLLAYVGLRWALARRGRQIPAIPWHPAMTWGVGVLVIVYSVVRNLPWGPFPYLASTA